jgi:hypothetical protein
MKGTKFANLKLFYHFYLLQFFFFCSVRFDDINQLLIGYVRSKIGGFDGMSSWGEILSVIDILKFSRKCRRLHLNSVTCKISHLQN